MRETEMPRLGLTSIARTGLLLGVVFTAGCQEGERELVPVSGTVHYQGQPLKGGTIVFVPDLERGGSGPTASAVIEPDGTYKLHTGEREGAVMGWHRVTVAGSDAVRDFPRRYMDPEQSGQLVEVKPFQPNTIDVNLD
jgi:hypothetical protein